MTTVQLKEKIHQYIDKADDRFIQLIYGMMQADLMGSKHELTNAHKKVLDVRIAAHKANPKSGDSWKDVKARIEKQL